MRTFAAAVGTARSPRHSPIPGTPVSAQTGGHHTPHTHSGVHPHNTDNCRPTCPVCSYRTPRLRDIGALDMATHNAGGTDGAAICPGSQMFSPTYAQSLDMRPWQDPRSLDSDLLGDGADDMDGNRGSPQPGASSPMSIPASPSLHSSAAGASPASWPETAAPLQDIYAQLLLSTDPADIRGLLAEGVKSSLPDPDDSDPDEQHTDTDAAAASCAMGEEHVMAIIEHIIATCTPVSEAHRLLSILQGAGTVPWRTLDPYVKVLRQWQSECGRQDVQSHDLRIQVLILKCMLVGQHTKDVGMCAHNTEYSTRYHFVTTPACPK